MWRKVSIIRQLKTNVPILYPMVFCGGEAITLQTLYSHYSHYSQKKDISDRPIKYHALRREMRRNFNILNRLKT
jgi:hypothetical protein